MRDDFEHSKCAFISCEYKINQKHFGEASKFREYLQFEGNWQFLFVSIVIGDFLEPLRRSTHIASVRIVVTKSEWILREITCSMVAPRNSTNNETTNEKKKRIQMHTWRNEMKWYLFINFTFFCVRNHHHSHSSRLFLNFQFLFVCLCACVRVCVLLFFSF